MSKEFKNQAAKEQDLQIADEKKPINLFGALKGTVAIRGDILVPLDEAWEAENATTTIAAIRESRTGNLPKARSIKELKKALHADD